MIKAGMDVARLNFSHGTYKQHADYVRSIRKCSQALSKTVAILQDLQGIKIRIGEVADQLIRIKTGNDILLKGGNKVSSESCLYIRHPGLVKDLKKGDRVLIDDGLILLRVRHKTGDTVEARIVEGGIISSRKGVNLPDTKIKASSFTSKDKKDLDFGLEQGIDIVAVSFVRSAEDIKKVKHYIQRKKADIPVIAKIERPEALRNIHSIIETADGIMIARGDLGVEMDTEEVPIIQKTLIMKANNAGKIVITATQMLESMTSHRRPTRAEVTDVANAIIDGSDAVMLSGETSAGTYPKESVSMMAKIIKYAERHVKDWEVYRTRVDVKQDYPYAVAEAAVKAANDIHAKAVVAFTDSGYTARLASKFRPTVPIIAFTASEKIQKRMNLYWGTTSFLMKHLKHTDEMVEEVEKFFLKHRYAGRGDTIVIIASSPLSVLGRTNFMKLHKLG